MTQRRQVEGEGLSRACGCADDYAPTLPAGQIPEHRPRGPQLEVSQFNVAPVLRPEESEQRGLFLTAKKFLRFQFAYSLFGLDVPSGINALAKGETVVGDKRRRHLPLAAGDPQTQLG